MAERQKNFRKRNAILACLRGTKEHPSAEMVYNAVREKNPDISLATVYRNLAYFVEKGDAICVGKVDGSERFDADTSPHSHFICRGCGRVIDIGRIPSVREMCEDLPELDGFLTESCSVTFEGLCPDCAEKGN